MEASHLPQEFWALAMVVLLLGMRHGFDADHLAAIDGLTRFNSRERPQLARRAGALFSLGHGLVVAAVALLVSTLASSWQVPQWLEATGAWVSISVLTLLALFNLLALRRTPDHEVSQLVGWRSGLFARALRAQQPWTVTAVGVLFAFSFDTMSQAALFALVGSKFGGWLAALTLAGLFIGGMLLTDGLNGLWIAGLIRRADHRAVLASRIMTLAVSGASLLTAAVGVAAQCSPHVGGWLEGRAWWLSVGIVAVMATSFLGGLAMSQRAMKLQPLPINA
jgi:high-affinity nickel-transport protein